MVMSVCGWHLKGRGLWLKLLSRVAYRAMVRMQSLRLDASAGKLDVCNFACTFVWGEGCVCETIESLGEVGG